jgi:hypothetical protein
MQRLILKFSSSCPTAQMGNIGIATVTASWKCRVRRCLCCLHQCNRHVFGSEAPTATRSAWSNWDGFARRLLWREIACCCCCKITGDANEAQGHLYRCRQASACFVTLLSWHVPRRHALQSQRHRSMSDRGPQTHANTCRASMKPEGIADAMCSSSRLFGRVAVLRVEFLAG